MAKYALGIVLFLSVPLVQCSSSSSNSGSALDGMHTGSSFALSSPTASSSRDGENEELFSDSRGLTITSSASMAAKKAILGSLFGATSLADCAVNLNLLNAANAACYGPSATYAGHPDGTPAAGSLPGGDLGIWENADNASQACAAAQMNARLAASASYADTGLFSTAAMICAARVTGLSKPTIGTSIDLTSKMTGLLTINGSSLSVTAASLSREANSSDGHEVYVSSITGNVGTTTYTIRMKHIPTDSSNTTNRGKISVTIAAADGTKPLNCSSSSATGHTIATSLEYEKLSATSMRIKMKDAQFCGDSADPFVSSTDKTVDHSKKLSGSLATGWANNANLLAASFDPSTGTGNYAYAWQAGHSDGNIRALNLNVTEASGTYTGTAFFGFGDDIQTTSQGAITKIICNWTGPGNSHTGITKAQRQVMTKASSATVFSVTSSNITYDPLNSCESSDNAFSVSWTNVAGASTSRTADTTTNNLVDVSTISSSYTSPTAPTTVD